MILDDIKELERESLIRKIPIIGSEKGHWIMKQVETTQPKKVLELGTANGYSGIILGSLGAELITVEKDKYVAEEAKMNFEKYNIHATVVVVDGVSFVDKLVKNKNNLESFDLIFIDFEKRSYIKVLDNLVALLSKHGILIADNISMQKCEDFKNSLLNNSTLSTEFVNIKDGFSLSHKK